MATTKNDLSQAVGQESSRELDSAVLKINHCINQLTDEQLWWRPAGKMNCVANLMLHLAGNLQQWIVSGVGGAVDSRERQKEFDATGPIPKAELVGQIEEVVAEAKRVLATVSAEELLRNRRIQGFEVTGLQAIFESVSHFRGHAQEIVHISRCQLGDSYLFDFVPSSAEQGSR